MNEPKSLVRKLLQNRKKNYSKNRARPLACGPVFRRLHAGNRIGLVGSDGRGNHAFEFDLLVHG